MAKVCNHEITCARAGRVRGREAVVLDVSFPERAIQFGADQMLQHCASVIHAW
jgi:hypothetical protein